MGEKLIDITGEKRGKLLVIGFSHTKRIGSKIRSYWRCRCDCGNEKGRLQYISNGNREDVVKALKEWITTVDTDKKFGKDI